MEKYINQSVLIIGAGPAGLTLAYYLQQNNIDYLILEQNERPGSSWSQMPDHLHLVSLWTSNYLLKEDLPLSSPYKAHSAKEFSAYLEDFARKHQLKIKNNTTVLDISKENGIFVVKTNEGHCTGTFVVDCRGYFNSPFTPPFQVTGEPPLMMHFKNYKSYLQLNQYEKILIVGKRLSAGQLLYELATHGKHQLFLSVKSKIQYGLPDFLLNLFLRNLNAIERFIKKFKLRLKEEIEVPMNFKVKKIVTKQVKVRGNILKIDNKKVYFTDGNPEEIDAIIFATGFRPSPISLRDDFESQTTDGLFYLGRGAQRTFTSRFIRGIREDAPILCQLILAKLASKNKFQ